MDREIFVTYIIPIIMAIFTAVAGWLSMQIKALCQRYLDNKTKRDVARLALRPWSSFTMTWADPKS